MERQTKREVINLLALGVEAGETNAGCCRVVRTGAVGRGVGRTNTGSNGFVKADACWVAIGVVNDDRIGHPDPNDG